MHKHNALLVRWGLPVRGREPQSARVFGEWMEMLGSWKAKGTIKSFTPLLLAPTGGDLSGLILVTAESTTLDELAVSDEMRRAVSRANLVVDHFGVVRATTDEETINKEVALFLQNASDITR